MELEWFPVQRFARHATETERCPLINQFSDSGTVSFPTAVSFDSPQELVRSQYPNAEIEIDETRERTKLYRVIAPSLSLPGLSVTCFSEEDAWQDAMERLTGKRPQL